MESTEWRKDGQLAYIIREGIPIEVRILKICEEYALIERPGYGSFLENLEDLQPPWGTDE